MHSNTRRPSPSSSFLLPKEPRKSTKWHQAKHFFAYGGYQHLVPYTYFDAVHPLGYWQRLLIPCIRFGGTSRTIGALSSLPHHPRRIQNDLVQCRLLAHPFYPRIIQDRRQLHLTVPLHPRRPGHPPPSNL